MYMYWTFNDITCCMYDVAIVVSLLFIFIILLEVVTITLDIVIPEV